MSHLTSRYAIRQDLLVWLLVALCCAIPHCRMFSTYQASFKSFGSVPESFREVVGSLLLRRQLGPDFNKVLEVHSLVPIGRNSE
uniref:Secreted protein n=1 Tax=Timema bartmani TaxID=61472 RepID=A0A7R9I5G6_9NEOP|nr:unnamed protein product [Timema bartmani]